MERIAILIGEIGGAGGVVFGAFLYLFKSTFKQMIALSYFNVSFSAGKFPNSLNGQLQITPDQGVTMASSQEDVATIAKKLIQAMVADQAEQESK